MPAKARRPKKHHCCSSSVKNPMTVNRLAWVSISGWKAVRQIPLPMRMHLTVWMPQLASPKLLIPSSPITKNVLSSRAKKFFVMNRFQSSMIKRASLVTLLPILKMAVMAFWSYAAPLVAVKPRSRQSLRSWLKKCRCMFWSVRKQARFLLSWTLLFLSYPVMRKSLTQ